MQPTERAAPTPAETGTAAWAGDRNACDAGAVPRRAGRRELAAVAAAGLGAAASSLALMHASGWLSVPQVPPSMEFPPVHLIVLALGLKTAIDVALDAGIAAYLAACLLAFQRPNPRGAVLSAAFAAAPVAASAAKYSVLGTPAQFGDVLLLGDLARATDAAWVAVAGAVALAAASAFALNLRPVRPRRAFLDLSPLLAAGAVLAAAAHSPGLSASLAELFPPRVADGLAVKGHVINGHLPNAYAEFLTSLARRHAIDGARAVAQPPSALGVARVPPLEKRNVHLVVLESLMDPTWLRGFAFSPAEPLTPVFARWRAEGRGSTAVVSIFGGRSANTEFEVLCGVPAAVGADEIAFWMIPGGSELPCLPRLLAAQGFRTSATSAASPRMANAGRALAAAGFQARAFAADLDTADRDGLWLSADGTLRQAEARAASLAAEGGGAPVLNYVFVTAGHYPYVRDKARRPDRVSIAPHDESVHDWANAAHYNAAAVEGLVGRIAAADPRALIVVLGDHQPPLGPDFHGYRIGGRLPPADDLPPFQKATMFETPLLVLDAGEIVPVGRLPAHLVPELVLDRLSGGEHCRANACAHRKPWRLRPFRDHAFEVEAHGPGERFCRTARERNAVEAPDCADVAARSRAWQAAMWRTLTPTALWAPDASVGTGR